MTFDSVQFLLDGAAQDATAAELWVSDDSARLAERLSSLAVAIAEERAPEGFSGRPLLRLDTAALKADLDAGDADVLTEKLLAETAQAEATLALPSLDALLGSVAGRAFLEGLRVALREGGMARFIGLVDRAGLAALLAETPRLAAFFVVHDLDGATEFIPDSVAFSSDSGGEGWVVAVRCGLTAPSSVLEGLEYGLDTALPGTGEALQDEGVESVFGLFQESGARTIVITLESDAAGVEDRDQAEGIAAAAVRRLIGRPLEDGESMKVSRLIYFAKAAAA